MTPPDKHAVIAEIAAARKLVWGDEPHCHRTKISDAFDHARTMLAADAAPIENAEVQAALKPRGIPGKVGDIVRGMQGIITRLALDNHSMRVDHDMDLASLSHAIAERNRLARENAELRADTIKLANAEAQAIGTAEHLRRELAAARKDTWRIDFMDTYKAWALLRPAKTGPWIRAAIDAAMASGEKA